MSNLNNAFDVAYKDLGLPRLLDAEGGGSLRQKVEVDLAVGSTFHYVLVCFCCFASYWSVFAVLLVTGLFFAVLLVTGLFLLFF